MSDLHQILTDIDGLSPDKLEAVYQHVAKKRQASYWLVSGEHVKRIQDIMRDVHTASATMSDDEIHDLIDEAIDEVRREARSGD